MANNGPPWNKGKTGLDAGWTTERRRKASRFKKAWLKANPDSPLGQKGPRPNSWSTGPDPKVHQHRYRFLKARAQAKYWSQEWTILWEDFLDLLKTAPGEWSRDKNALNITRIDTTKGWHIWNVRLMRRLDAMRRPNKGKHRIQPKGQGSKARGINWRKGGHTKKVVKKRTAPVMLDKPKRTAPVMLDKPIDTDEYNQMKYKNHPSMKKNKGGYRGKPNHPNRNHKFS